MDIFSAKFVFLALIALIVLGPDKLPASLRTGARVLGEVRRLAAQAQEHSRALLDDTGLSEPLAELRSLSQAVGAPVTSMRNELHDSLTSDLPGPAPERHEDPQAHLELVWP